MEPISEVGLKYYAVATFIQRIDLYSELRGVT